MRSTQRPEIHGIVETALDETGIGPGSSILCALSGGPDSVALVSLLHGIASSRRIRIAAAYVDHGIRNAEEIAEEILFVRELCASLQIPLFLRHVPPGDIERLSHASGSGLEDAARTIRYRLLGAVVEEEGFDFLAVGHNRDDVSETLIMRFFRGSGPFGLRGIPPGRGRIIRPLLSCTRDQILSYLEKTGLGYRTDTTNLENRYLRNRVRLELLQAVRSVFPGYGKALVSLAEKMGDAAAVIERLAAQVPWEKTASGFRLPVASFKSLDRAVQVETLYRIFDAELSPKGSRSVSYGAIRKAITEGDLHNGATILEGDGWSVSVSGGSVFWSRDVVLTEKKGYLIEVHQGQKFTFGNTSFSVHEEIGTPDGDAEIWLPKARIKPPLIVRSRAPGDAIILERGTTKLKKLFSEWGIPENLRLSIPVIAHADGIVAVMGRPFGFRNRISRTMRVQEPGEESLLVIRMDILGEK